MMPIGGLLILTSPLLQAASYQYDSDHTLIGHLQTTAVQTTDTLIDIAREFALGYEEIVQANPDLDPWLPGEGSQVILPNQFILPYPEFQGIFINLAEMRLYYYPPVAANDVRMVATYPISIGREEWRTPVSSAEIIDKLVNPSWYPPKSVRIEHAQMGDPLPRVVPPGDDNPLGQYALQLNLPGYFIHGTNRPEGIGMRVTHGCIRMRPEDISDLFSQIPRGTKVTIGFMPHKVALVDGVIYFEAHQGGYKEKSYMADSLITVSKLSKRQNIAVDWERMLRVAKRGRGVPLPLNVGIEHPHYTDVSPPVSKRNTASKQDYIF